MRLHVHFYPWWKRFNNRLARQDRYGDLFEWEVRCRCGKEKTRSKFFDGEVLDLR